MMTKTMATLAALALTSVFTATGATASATNAGPDPGTDPVIGAWTWSSFTDWQTDPNPPADPDGQAGEDNLLNVTQIGERFEQEVEGAGTTETTDWVLESPGEGWVQIDQRTVTDVEAHEDVIVEAQPGQHYSWNGGNRGVDDPPTVVPPHADWQANTEQEPPGHLVSATWLNESLHVTGNSPSNASWFYYVHPVEEVVEHHDAVTHEEFRYELTTYGTVTEYRWSVYTRVNTPGTPPGETPPGETPPGETPPGVNPAADVPPSVSTPPKASTPAAPAVPVSIDAGL